MREIKFRAWDHHHKKMRYPNGPIAIGCLTYDGTPIIHDEIGNPIEKAFEYSLMQFTGLHDKNGKEIYEGDLYQFDYWTSGKPLEVVYEPAMASFGVRMPGFCHITGGIHGEVVGNVHENPELLKAPSGGR